MEMLKQFRENVNCMANKFDCMIEICNTHTITLGYQRRFSSHFTLELHLA